MLIVLERCTTHNLLLSIVSVDIKEKRKRKKKRERCTTHNLLLSTVSVDIATAKGTLHNGQSVTDTLLSLRRSRSRDNRMNSMNIGKRRLPIFILNNLLHRNQTYNILERMHFKIKSTFDMNPWLFFSQRKHPLSYDNCTVEKYLITYGKGRRQVLPSPRNGFTPNISQPYNYLLQRFYLDG